MEVIKAMVDACSLFRQKDSRLKKVVIVVWERDQKNQQVCFYVVTLKIIEDVLNQRPNVNVYTCRPLSGSSPIGILGSPKFIKTLHNFTASINDGCLCNSFAKILLPHYFKFIGQNRLNCD